MVVTMRRRTLPSSPIDFCGALILVLRLTDGIVVLFNFRLNDRSKIHRYWRDLWGITANGEIFVFGGKLCLIFPYVVIIACLLFCFSMASVMMYCRA